jgi:hypothetical protein
MEAVTVSAIEKREERAPVMRPPIGLLISIGDITQSKGGRDIPTRIDHFRAKPGQLAQYAGAALKFDEVYGDEPKQIDDLFFLSNNIADVLDIRLRAWGTSGIRIAGQTNYATLPPEEWEQRAFAFDDEVVFFPIDASEVRKEDREAWDGEPIYDQLRGPDDPRIAKLSISVECTLSFCLPEVMGFGTVAQITTKGRRSMRNLHTSVVSQHTFFQGQLVGIPFRLSVRPARTRYFDREKRKYVATEFFELVLDTALTVAQMFERVRERREALGVPLDQRQIGPGTTAEAELLARAITAGGAEEEVHVRDEPTQGDRPTDDQLNRIAMLEQELGGASEPYLVGAFNVERADALTREQADQYEAGLQRLADAAAEDGGEPEIVEEPDEDESPFQIPDGATDPEPGDQGSLV